MYGRKDIYRKAGWGREIEPGGEIPIRTSKGLYIGRWGGIVKPGERIQGHARDESLKKTWLDKRTHDGKKIWHEVEIPGIELFSERNTVLKNGEIVRFTVPDGHTIKAIARQQVISKKEKVIDVRIVTTAAAGAVKGIHHRMPVVQEAKYKDAK
jgi:hypothetical protein